MVVTPEDYILGMSDLTGELMRYATNGMLDHNRRMFADGYVPCCFHLNPIALSTGDHETPLAVCDFVRTVKGCEPSGLQVHNSTENPLTDFDGIPSSMLWKLNKKQEETSRSVQKIEKRMSPLPLAERHRPKASHFHPPPLLGRLSLIVRLTQSAMLYD